MLPLLGRGCSRGCVRDFEGLAEKWRGCGRKIAAAQGWGVWERWVSFGIGVEVDMLTEGVIVHTI